MATKKQLKTTEPSLKRDLYENINNNFDFSVNTWDTLESSEKRQEIYKKREEYTKRYNAEMKELAELEITI